MGGEEWLFLFAVLFASALMFMSVFFIMMFSDLELEYINRVDLCIVLNKIILPENGTHLFLTLLFILSRQWTALLLNIPLVAFNYNKIVAKDRFYDWKKVLIFRIRQGYKRECFIKLGFYLLSFFYYLYRMILAALTISE